VIISKDKLNTFERWQLVSFDAPAIDVPPMPEAPPAVEEEAAPPPPAPLPPTVDLPTEEEIAQIREDARQAGYEAGYQAGLLEGKTAGEATARAVAEDQRLRFEQILSNLRHALDTMDQEIAEQLLETALGISAQITRGIISSNKAVLIPVINEAIACLPTHHGHIVVRLHPEDVPHVRELLGEQFSQSGTQIIEDKTLAPGGCLLQAGGSEVDASLETRWRQVLETIGAEPKAWLTN